MPDVLNHASRLARAAVGGTLLLAISHSLSAAIIGTNPPAQPLTADRIAALPRPEQSVWEDYLKRSDQQSRQDRMTLQAELRRAHLAAPLVPPSGHSVASIPLNREDNWYCGGEAWRIADIIVSFQTPAGGWSKNLNLNRNPRVSGENYAPNNTSRFPGPADFDAEADPQWNYVGTFDNDATTTEMRFLARVIATTAHPAAAWRKAFLRGLDYIFAAQFPNGGWPQVWPLQGGYHDAITFNDDAMLNVLTLLRDVSDGYNEFSFVPAKYRARAKSACERGVTCALATQVVIGGRRTVWCQQYDALTLQPTSARNYEMPAKCSSESADLMLFLMDEPHPNAAVIAAVDAAAAWFEKTGIHDQKYTFGPDGRDLEPCPGAGPLWARYYAISSDRPIFGDRDKTIHDRLDEISLERRKGYGWYGENPARALAQYADWKKLYR